MDRNIWTQLFYLPVILTSIALKVCVGVVLFMLAFVIAIPLSIFYIILYTIRNKGVLK